MLLALLYIVLDHSRFGWPIRSPVCIALEQLCVPDWTRPVSFRDVTQLGDLLASTTNPRHLTKNMKPVVKSPAIYRVRTGAAAAPTRSIV